MSSEKKDGHAGADNPKTPQIDPEAVEKVIPDDEDSSPLEKATRIPDKEARKQADKKKQRDED